MTGRSLPSHWSPSLWLAAAFAVAVGLCRGFHFVAAGFPWLMMTEIRQSLRWALLITMTFLLAFELFRALARRLSADRPLTPPWLCSATVLAALPWILWGGMEWNRAHGIRPSMLLEGYALRSNGLFLIFCAVLWGAATWLILRGRNKAPKRDLSWLGVVAAVTVLELTMVWAFQPDKTVKKGPDVLLLLVDALRADHLSAYGASRPTPAIDSLAQDGILFQHTISQSTFTKSSIASLFTGRHVYQHGVYWGSNKETPGSITSDLLSENETTLSETLAKQGYLTNAWVQNGHLRGFMGFGQGFVDYHDQQGSIQRIHRRLWPFLHGAAQRYNFFTYLHYIDLHDPYLPTAPYDSLYSDGSDVYQGIDLDNWGTYLAAVRQGEEVPSEEQVVQLEAYYDGLIRMVDDEIGRLLAELRRTGLYDSSLIILTSDHGDAFMEHGFISHSTTPYEELSRVPLIIKLPKQEHAATVVEPMVRLVDVMPTLLGLVGLDTPRPVAGCDVRPLWQPDLEPRSPNCLWAVSEIAEEGSYPTIAVRSERLKYLHFESRPDEVYDLQQDPMELSPLDLDSLPEDDPRRREADLLRHHALEVHSLRQNPAEKIELDAQQIRELKALGYLD